MTAKQSAKKTAHQEIDALITALSPNGTREQFASLLAGTIGRDIKGNTIRQWVTRGSIPFWARPCIAKLAAASRVSVPAGFIEGV